MYYDVVVACTEYNIVVYRARTHEFVKHRNRMSKELFLHHAPPPKTKLELKMRHAVTINIVVVVVVVVAEREVKKNSSF